jgi:hypothetical protein
MPVSSRAVNKKCTLLHGTIKQTSPTTSSCGLKTIELLLVQSYYKHELCTETYTQLIYAVDKILQKKIFCCVDFLLN